MKERLDWLDSIKATAILLVLLIHSIELVYLRGDEFWLGINQKERVVVTFLFSLGRLAVPLFLFVTGYLFLTKRYKTNDDVLNFYKRKWLPLLKTTYKWLIIYILFEYLFMGNSSSKGSIIRQLLFMEQPAITSFWYMPMLLSLYAMLPFVGNLINKFSFTILKYVYFLGVLNLMIVPSLQHLLSYTAQIKIAPLSVQPMLFNGLYGLYVVSGFYLKKEQFSKIKASHLWCLTITSLLIMTSSQVISWIRLAPYWIWYDSIFIFSGASGLFLLIKKMIFPVFIKKTNQYLSKNTLTIYFVHFPLQIILNKLINCSNNLLNMLLLFTSSILLSFSFVKIKNGLQEWFKQGVN